MARVRLKHFAVVGKAAWYLISAPVKLTQGLTGIVSKTIGAALLVTRDSFQCPGCGNRISLVGRWECSGCGFKFDGFFLPDVAYAVPFRRTFTVLIVE